MEMGHAMDSFDAELWIERARKLGWEYILADDGALYFRPRNGTRLPGASDDGHAAGQGKGWFEIAPGNGTACTANAAAVRRCLTGNGSSVDIAVRREAGSRGTNDTGK
jgi:hypothetical protein